MAGSPSDRPVADARAPLVVIPARMAASRLPGKPLADIAGRPMIVRVWEIAARWAQTVPGARVVVAAAEAEIADAVRAAGGEAVLTAPDLPSGSDRVNAAARIADPEGRHDVVINLQGDQPVFDEAILSAVLYPMRDPAVDVATLAAPIEDEAERTNPDVVKAVISLPPHAVPPHAVPSNAASGGTAPEAAGGHAPVGRALYFTRATAPAGDGPLFHHIGIYAFRPAALARFVALPPSPLEQRERLEQLRALEAGMRIDVAIVPQGTRIGVDSPADLERARSWFAARGEAASGPAPGSKGPGA